MNVPPGQGHSGLWASWSCQVPKAGVTSAVHGFTFAGTAQEQPSGGDAQSRVEGAPCSLGTPLAQHLHVFFT